MSSKTYEFRRSSISPRHNFVMIEKPDAHLPSVIGLTPSTYNRYVALANSGSYAVEILDADYGVAWQMRRKEAA